MLAQRQTGFLELGHVPFDRAAHMAKIIPSMVALESHRTVYGLVSKYIKDRRLQKVFSFHPLLVGGNPFSTTSIYALIAYLERHWGVWYAMGGTGAMVQGIAALAERLGSAAPCVGSVTMFDIASSWARDKDKMDGLSAAALLWSVARSPAPWLRKLETAIVNDLQYQAARSLTHDDCGKRGPALLPPPQGIAR